MHAHRVNIFNRAHDHGVVGAIAHHLEFILFPPEDGFLQQHFGGGAVMQPIAHHPNQFRLVVGKP